MAFKCGFFDSTSAELVSGFYRGNKAQDAAFFARREAALIGNGIYQGSFTVAPGAGLAVSRSVGQAWINGYYCYDDSAASVTLLANATYYYVLRLHLGDGEITEQWLTAYTTPVRSGNVYDMLLAKVIIPAGTVNITADMITDYRIDATKCGYAALQPNVDFSKIIVSADEVVDTANHMIPVKTGDGMMFLKNNGTYDTLSSKIVDVTVNKTLVLTDANSLQKMNSSSALTVTVPLNSAVPFPIGTEFEIVRWNTGTVTIAKTAGVTIYAVDSPASLTISSQYGVVTLKKMAVDIWLISGALS